MAFLPGLQKTGQGCCVGAIAILMFCFNLFKKGKKESVF